MASNPVVHVVDDDDYIREAVGRLLSQVNLRYRTYANAQEFSERFDPTTPGCVLLDVRMPGMSGTQLLRKLMDESALTPIIMLTGCGDVPTAVESLRRGAFDFLEKPIVPQMLLDRIQQALQLNRERRQAAAERAALEARFAQLTKREREVVDLVADGMNNRQIAERFGVSSQAVDAARNKAMAKLGSQSVAGLAQMVMKVRGFRQAVDAVQKPPKPAL